MHDILAKPAAIATCGLFNMKRRAKEALPAQGSKTLAGTNVNGANTPS